MTAKEQGLPQNVTEDQRRAIQSFVHSAIVPLIEDVIVKKLGQAAIVLRDELSGAAIASDTDKREIKINPEIIGNPDAAAWADCFAKAHPKSAIGWDVMVGWFANAMMAAHDHALAKPVKITPDILAAVAGYYHDGPVRNWEVVRAIESSIAALAQGGGNER